MIQTSFHDFLNLTAALIYGESLCMTPYGSKFATNYSPQLCDIFDEVIVCFPTNPFTILELKKSLHDVPKLKGSSGACFYSATAPCSLT